MKKMHIALAGLIMLLGTEALMARVHDGFKYDHFRTGMSMQAAFAKIKRTDVLYTHDDRGIVNPPKRSKAFRILNGKKDSKYNHHTGENTIVYNDTLMAVPATTALKFDKNGRLWEVEITAPWSRIKKVYDTDSFLPKIKRRLTKKYKVDPFYQDYGQMGGIADAARVEWRINHHSTIWYVSEPNQFKLVYEYRRWSNEDDRHKL